MWRRLILDLRARGGGKRESGAFILGDRNGSVDRARIFVPYDELDPAAFESGIIRFGSSGYPKLWEICRKRKQRVVADVHAHPSTWVNQSDSDQAHPMIPEAGHLAIILPNFADTSWWTLTGVGLHEYLGSRRWRPQSHPSRAQIVLW
jgi:proteasome lid subunit RPN8/RPN11